MDGAAGGKAVMEVHGAGLRGAEQVGVTQVGNVHAVQVMEMLALRQPARGQHGNLVRHTTT